MKKIYFLITFLLPYMFFAQAGSESAIVNINSTIPFQGIDETESHIGTGEYKIYYDNVDGVLDKPIFFVDGFDPNDTRDIPSMYGLLDYGNPVENLADVVRNEGFDLVVLNFPTYTRTADGAEINGGADYIQRNAFILIALINEINGMKTGVEENVVIGPSMGGLISRYALSYMEQNTMDHDTRLYISFDSPHLGANVPIGIQYLFNYMLNGAGITELEPLVNGLLNSPAAKQMLIDHYLGHVDGGGVNQSAITHTPIGAPNYRDAFHAELTNLGFPEDTRNVAISNGSGIAQITGTPGMELINHTFDVEFGITATADIHFTPAANQNITVTDVLLSIFGFPVTYSATAESPATSDGIDSAPGGQFDLYSFDDGSNALITEFVDNLNSQYFNFIPTLSSLAITDSNWYNTPNMTASPFVNAYIPDNNEPHVTLTDLNVAFALNEILENALTIQEQVIADNYIKIAQNPINEHLTLIAQENFKNTSISITDLTGKSVFKTVTNLNAKTDIAINVASGLYILNINTQKGISLREKIVVR
ncbi:T9SS type A sorting domain-containing protein [Mangrovimonas cancribranchiae]|uniref:T9SS type A sorting domain-containing protein n=1 Tax=Mangrovimonas cancribranchiae TaxID=3080055 RepID=A0AAU6P258_9FLAO